MNMEAQAEELTRRVHAARAARLHAQRMRLLAAERAEKLERELKNAAESGLKAEISRTLEARGRLQVASKRKSAARYSGIAAISLLFGASVLGISWARSQNAAGPGQPASHPPVLGTAHGDRLQLALSYSISLPAPR
jgi:hypothetical protein